MLIEPNNLGLSINTGLIIVTAIVNTGFFMLIVHYIIKLHKTPTITGLNTLMGKQGYSLNAFKKEGQIKVNGEIWSALSTEPIKKNQAVIITDINNKQLYIKPFKEER